MGSNQSIKLYETLKQLPKTQFDEVCFYLQNKYGYDLAFITLEGVSVAKSAQELISFVEQYEQGFEHLEEILKKFNISIIEKILCDECGTSLPINHNGACPNCGNPYLPRTCPRCGKSDKVYNIFELFCSTSKDKILVKEDIVTTSTYFADKCSRILNLIYYQEKFIIQRKDFLKNFSIIIISMFIGAMIASLYSYGQLLKTKETLILFTYWSICLFYIIETMFNPASESEIPTLLKIIVFIFVAILISFILIPTMSLIGISIVIKYMPNINPLLVVTLVYIVDMIMYNTFYKIDDDTIYKILTNKSQKKVWQSLHYCELDDCVFNSSKRECKPIEQIDEFYYISKKLF